MANINDSEQVRDIVTAWRAIPNLVIDQDGIKSAEDREDWLAGAEQANEDMQQEADEVRLELEGLPCDPEDDLDEDEPVSPEEEFAAHTRSSVMSELREELLHELINLEAWDTAIKLVIELGDQGFLELVFGELAKDGNAGRARAEIISAKLPQHTKYQLCFELFHQTGSELFLNYVQTRLLVELTKSGKSNTSAGCVTYANLLIHLWCLREQAGLLDMAVILAMGSQDWFTWVKLAKATGQLNHYRRLLDEMHSLSGRVLVDCVMQVADLLALNAALIRSPDSVPPAVKQFVRPLSEQDLQTFLSEVPPQHRKVYEKRLQQTALNRTSLSEPG